MPRSLKVSPDCIGTVKVALKQQGILSQRALSEELSVALSTVSNFFNGKPVDRAIFEEICTKLALPWKEIAASEDEVAIAPPYKESLRLQDWGEAPQLSRFYGRADELSQLEDWLCHDHCRLVTVLGMGGVGKTSLIVKLVEQLQDRFEGFVWRSLRNLPPIETLLKNLLQTLAHPQPMTIPDRLPDQMSLLIEFLRDRRYLLILDNAESLLQGGERAGHYREGYTEYEELLNRIAHGRHQSCLVVTSRERLGQLAAQEIEDGPTRSLQLGGLSRADGAQILQAKGLTVAAGVEQLMENYRGNPLALKIAAATIQSTFDGDVTRFQQQNIGVYGGIWDLLKQQCDRLSPLEQAVMDWLAIEREWISFAKLQQNWIAPMPQRNLLEALESLQGRSLIEVSSLGYTQQPVVMEYITQTFIDRCHHEITSQTLDVIRSHALLKAQTQDYIRDSQARLILQPLIQKLLVTLHDSIPLEFFLNQILNALRGKPLSYTGYAAGNVINLLNALRSNLDNCDFSDLVIAQVYFTNTTLQNTDFTGSTFYQSTFAEVFGGIIAVAFSADGKYLAISDARTEVHVWNLLTQRKLLTLQGHKSWVFSLVFSPTGKNLASASDDYVVKLWGMETGQCLQTLKGPANLLNAVTFNSDEQCILYDETVAIQLWNVDHPEYQIAALQGNTLLARSTALSPDGRAIAISTRDQTIKLWNIQTGECYQTLSGHTGDVRMLRFSASGRYLASTSLDLSIRLWDLESGQCIHFLQGHGHGVSETAFSPDEQYLTSSSFDRTLKLWDIATGQCLRTFHGHQKHLMACAFSPDGQLIASGGGDHAVKLWDAKTGQCVKTVQGYANAVTRIALTPPLGYMDTRASHNHSVPRYGKHPILASAHEDKTVKLWDVSTGHIVKTLPPQADLIWGLTFSPDASLLVTANTDHTIKLWNWYTGECLQTLQHGNWGWAVAFHPSGFPLATGSYDQTIKIWNIHTGECLQTLCGHTSAVLSVTYSPDGHTLVSSSHDKTIRLWNPVTGECVRVLEGHGDRIGQARFSPDGQFLVSCSYDETIRFWDPHTGECFRTLRGHQGAITSICFSPDAQHLISGSFDQTIKIWDVATGECLRTLQGHSSGILSLLYEATPLSLEGGDRLPLILSSSFDGTIKIWHPETGACVKSLIAPRPYDGMNISGVSGLTAAQEANLKLLGAIVAG
ncbi:NB-ARC domain-containing protein [Leptolyngbya sp. FACHB-8]|uniref:NB-ARC domain-containing protein n=1 Tax=unclassified Leptolyngbya TaxID=2650499 RepID=UPI00168845F9|nr:NB-ARC domain-containing protein [Leptolyngbya sp. FACHB-8]MBD1909457.1 NACHT domain-containing protein [Leptolyngbya sp. FACHB-8]